MKRWKDHRGPCWKKIKKLRGWVTGLSSYFSSSSLRFASESVLHNKLFSKDFSSAVISFPSFPIGTCHISLSIKTHYNNFFFRQTNKKTFLDPIFSSGPFSFILERVCYMYYLHFLIVCFLLNSLWLEFLSLPHFCKNPQWLPWVLSSTPCNQSPSFLELFCWPVTRPTVLALLLTLQRNLGLLCWVLLLCSLSVPDSVLTFIIILSILTPW